MEIQIKRANLLTNLHVKGDPLILFNIWDPGSAQVVQEAGAKAIATGNWSVAAAHGYEDGEKLPFDVALANLQRISSKVNLPVTFDLEGGYGKSPEKIKENITKVIEAGAVGVNFEDQIIGGECKGLYSIKDQCIRIKAIHDAAERASIPIFINARTDIFLNALDQNENSLEEALNRAFAYAEAGANGFFVPGLKNIKHIEKLCKLLQLPVNIMILSDTPSLKELAEAGVARISYGPNPYSQLMKVLKANANEAFIPQKKRSLTNFKYSQSVKML